MAFEECMASIKAAMGGKELTDSQWDRITDDLTKVIDKHRAKGADRLTERVMQELAEKADNDRIANIVRQRNSLLNRRKQLELQDYIRTVWSDSPAAGFKALLQGISRSREGARYSVATNQQAKAEAYLAGMYSDLAEQGVWKHFNSGKLDQDVYVAKHRMDAGDTDLSDLIPEAVTIAKIIEKHSEFMRLEFNRVGGAVGKLEGWVTGRTHNSEHIRKDADGWLEFMKENLDFEKSFDDVPPEKRIAKLEQVRAEFIAGTHVQLRHADGPDTNKFGLTGMGAVGKGMSKERVFHFKTPEAEYEYNQRFGNGGLSQSVFFHAERMAADTVLMERLGPNAKMNLDAAFDAFEKDAKVSTDPKKLQDLRAYRRKVDNVTWKHLSGQARAVAVGGELLAKADAIVRTGQQMASLGGALLSMPSDIAFYAGEFRHQGRGFLSGAAETLKSLSDLTTSPEKRKILRSMGIFADSLKGTAISRFDANDLNPGQMSKWQHQFFKWTGIHWWPDRLRDGFALSMANHMADLADGAFDQMEPAFQKVLKSYGLMENEWEVMRKGIQEAEDGTRYMTPEAIMGLEDEAFSALLTKQGIKPTGPRIKALKSELSGKIQTMMQDRASFAVVEGGIETRQALVGAGEVGTWERTIRNQFALFKSFPIGVVLKPIARELFGGAESLEWRKAIKEGNGLPNVAMTMATATLLGYVSMSIKDMARGKEPRDPLSMETLAAAFVQGGSAGLYADVLFGEAASYDGGIVESLAGPTAGDLNDLGAIWYGMLHGDDVAAKTFKTVVNNLPGNNVFYTRAALDYLFLYQVSEHLSPGYLKRMERRLKKEGGREMFFPPSHEIPHGGGSRLFEGVR